MPCDGVRCQWWQQVWGGWNVNNWQPWAELSLAQCQPHLTSPCCHLTVTKEESPGRWTLPDRWTRLITFSCLDLSVQPFIQPARQRSQRIQTSTSLHSNAQLADGGGFLFLPEMVLSCIYQLKYEPALVTHSSLCWHKSKFMYVKISIPTSNYPYP